MLIFPLKKEWYEKIKRGEKTIEFREVKPYWTQRLLKNAHNCELMVGNYVLLKKGACVPCKLRLGYTSKYMTAIITRIDMVDGKDTDLHIDKPVYAIHLADVREVDGGIENEV